jgi:hypothetical protein
LLFWWYMSRHSGFFPEVAVPHLRSLFVDPTFLFYCSTTRYWALKWSYLRSATSNWRKYTMQKQKGGWHELRIDCTSHISRAIQRCTMKFEGDNAWSLLWICNDLVEFRYRIPDMQCIHICRLCVVFVVDYKHQLERRESRSWDERHNCQLNKALTSNATKGWLFSRRKWLLGKQGTEEHVFAWFQLELMCTSLATLIAILTRAVSLSSRIKACIWMKHCLS